MNRVLCAILFFVLLFGSKASASSHVSVAVPVIAANDNRTSAGTLSRGVLRLSLDTRTGLWSPDGPNRPNIPVEAFGEVGHTLQIPGPLVRVPLGTVIVARVRNSIPGTVLAMHGMTDRPAGLDHPFDLHYGQERIVRFRAGALGTYYYWGTTTGNIIADRLGRDSQLAGAIVVDDPRTKWNALTDRVFVITDWDDVHKAKGGIDFKYQMETINGRSYPATERLTYERGTLVRWHVVNASYEDHPLHLHGFYFAIGSRGDGLHDDIYPRLDRESKVTELIPSGSTSTMSWRATRSGNWMLHCHLAYHIIPHASLSPRFASRVTVKALEHAGKMGGMILMVTVNPKPGDRPVAARPATRRMDLLVERAPGDTVNDPAFRYVLQENGTATTSPGAIGPPIILTRGETVGITVTNHLGEPTAVHWHGIEQEDSYYDGVPNVSGYGNRLEPMIDPGESFEARFAPPRAGTFIYHTHMDDVWQLRGGLSGPLIVLPAGAHFDSATDHIVQITTPRNPADEDWLYVNGTRSPPAMTIAAGVAQRFRLINSTTFAADAVVSLVTAAGPAVWVPIASDGADLPASRQRPEPAVQTITIGETRDFTFEPHAPGEYRLMFWGFPGDSVRVTIPVHVVSQLPQGER
jgi:manganese oxidase